MKTTQLIILSTIFAQPLASAESQPAQDNLNISTPVPITAKWVDERDLTLLFDQSDNRILLAEYIISECVNNSTLSTLTRADGLRIAGHICYRDGSYENANNAFSALRDLDASPRWNSEAYRMLAQLSMDESDINITIDLFTQAWNFALQDDPDGLFLSTKSLFNTLCSLNSAIGNHEIALETAQVGIALYSKPNTQREKAQFIYWAYKANKNLGDNAGALFNLNDLLDNHPDFQANNNILGIPPLLRVDQFALQNQAWDHPSEDFVNTVIDICYNPDYLYMPSRLIVLENFGKLLEKNEQYDAVLHIRSTLRNELASQLDTNNSIEQLLKSDLQGRLARLALDDAKLQLELGDPVSAVATLTEITNSQNALPQEILDQASSLTETAQNSFPGP